MAVESQQSLKKKTPRVVYDKQMYILVGGFNPSKKYQSNLIISPGRGENNKYLKPPTSIYYDYRGMSLEEGSLSWLVHRPHRIQGNGLQGFTHTTPNQGNFSSHPFARSEFQCLTSQPYAYVMPKVCTRTLAGVDSSNS